MNKFSLFILLAFTGCSTVPKVVEHPASRMLLESIDEVNTGPALLLDPKLTYQGAFRLPQVESELDRFGYGGYVIAFKPESNTLLVSGHDELQTVAEVSLPQPQIYRDYSKLPVAKLVHPFVDLSDGLRERVPDSKLGGMLVDGKYVLWSYYKYYNVDGTNVPHLGVSNSELSHLDGKGLWSLLGIHMQKSAGRITRVPERWRSRFGYSHLTGLSIPQGRAYTSSGPSAFGYNPLTASGFRLDKEKIPTTTFLDYPQKTPVSYYLGGTKRTWKGSDTFHGSHFLESGERIAFASLVRLGTSKEDYYGEPEDYLGPVCANEGKGYLGGPYVSQIWLYNPDALLLAKGGRRKPWTLRPYKKIDISKWFLSAGECNYVGGFAYDKKSQRIFIVEPFADGTNEYEFQPIIHVWRVE